MLFESSHHLSTNQFLHAKGTKRKTTVVADGEGQTSATGTLALVGTWEAGKRAVVCVALPQRQGHRETRGRGDGVRRSAVVWRSGSARPGRPTGKSRGGRVARSSPAVLACMHARDVFPSSGGGGPLARVFFGNRDACRPWGPSFPVGKFVQSFHRRFKVPLPNVVAHQQRTRFARLLFVFFTVARVFVCVRNVLCMQPGRPDGA